MRQLVFAAAIAGTALSLAACSSGTDDAMETTDETAMVDDATVAPSAGSTVLDANTASAEELQGASGVSPELAEAIVAGRPYADVTALNATLIEAGTPEEAADVLTGVFVPVNLNTASEEAIMLIPGMTERMEHEFMEYRPYDDMAEFDREIGKYVDEAEVARFRSYVTL